MIEPKIVNPSALLASKGYFAMGEWMVTKAGQFLEKNSNKLPKNKE